jgi:hypothetical protein
MTNPNEPIDPNAPVEPRPEPPPTPLGYRSGIDERASRPRVPVMLQGFCGFLISGSVICGAGLIGAVVSNSSWIGLLMVLLACGVMGVIAYAMREDDFKRGWAVGIVVGIGLVGLLDGACFIMVR